MLVGLGIRLSRKANELLLGVYGHDPHQSSPPTRGDANIGRLGLTVMQFYLWPYPRCFHGRPQLTTSHHQVLLHFYVYKRL